MDHNAAFSEQGYTIIRSVFSEAYLEPIRLIVSEIIAFAEANPGDLFSNYYLKHRPDQGALYDLYQRIPEFAEMARNPAIVEVLAKVYSPNFYLYENSLVYKPMGKDNAVPWHQDFINRPDEPIKVVAWMAIDDVTIENGCMWAIPGSHKHGFLPWYKVKGETHHTRLDLSKTGIDESQSVPLVLNAGDVLLFNQLLLHSSRRVDSELPRRAYRVSYQNFDTSFTPRGTPIVISMRNKEVLCRPAEAQNISLGRKILRKIGNRLASL